MINPLKKFKDIKEVEEEVDGNSKAIITKKRKALNLTINEGAAASFAQGMGARYITPFAVAINSSAFQVGVLTSLSGLVSPIAQLFGSKLMSNHTRKNLVTRFVLFQSMTWLTLIGIAILYWQGFFREAMPWALIICYSLVALFGGLSYPAWFSWVGDLVPPSQRGRYFSIRNKVVCAVTIVAVLVGSFILDSTRTHGLVLIGFSVLFALAFAFRFVSYTLFRHEYAPRIKIRKKDYFSIYAFLKRFDNYGKFSIYKGIFYFALMIASPFFSVYMLRNLGFENNYLLYILVAMSATVFYLIFAPLVGRFSDRFGNLKLIYLGNALFVITPLLWIFLKNPFYLIFGPQIISGLANASFIIGTTNFTYDSVSPKHRGICSAYSNLLVGIGTFLGSILGGILINEVSLGLLNSFFIVFIISAVARLLAGAIFLPQIKEVKPVEKLPPIHISLLHPIRSLGVEVAWVREISRSPKTRKINP